MNTEEPMKRTKHSTAAESMYVRSLRALNYPSYVFGILCALSGVLFAVGRVPLKVFYQSSASPVTWVGILMFVVGCYFIALAGRRSAQVIRAEDLRIEGLANRIQEQPQKPQLAWDLARATLERYLERNLRQVASIYRLTLLVMIFGMVMVLIGVSQAMMEPGLFAASALSAVAGILIQMIGGTFLIIYRSTMAQANSYVSVLERINAVGMSINILETVGDEDQASRNSARMELARNLLGMYGIQNLGRAGEGAKSRRGPQAPE